MADTNIELQKQPAKTADGTEWTRNRKVYAPRVDIYETKDTIVLLADMPGVDEKSANVTLEKDVLTITGTFEPPVYKDHTIAHYEYDTGDYYRVFTISDEVNRENIEATVKNGVLRLVLHKAEPDKARKITIKTQ